MGAIVLLPLCVDDAALDRCLAALDAGTAPGTAVWLADDAQTGPRAQAVVEHWLAHTPLQAEYTRARPLGKWRIWTRCCAPAMAWTWSCWPRTVCRHPVGCSSCRMPLPATPRSPLQPRGATRVKLRPGRAWARSIPSPMTQNCWLTSVAGCRRCTRNCHRRSPMRCWCVAMHAVAPVAWMWTATPAGTRPWSTSACAWPAWAGATCCARPPLSAGLARRSAVMATLRRWLRVGPAGCRAWQIS